MIESNPGKSAQDLLKSSRKVRLEAFRDFKVQHPLLLETYDELWGAIRDANPGSIIFVYGPAGVGKTTLLKRIKRQLTEMKLDELKTNPELLPTIYFPLPAPTSGSFDWPDYFRRLLIELAEPLVDHKIDTGRWNLHPQNLSNKGPNNVQLTCSERPSTTRMRLASEQALFSRKPPALLLDDAQHLGILSSGRKLLDQLNIIKSVTDASLVTHCLCGTYELIPLRNLNGQLSRRSLDVHFGRYHIQNEAQRQAFMNVLFSFQQRLPLIKPPDLVTMWDYFYERSIGCVGVLKDWLTLSLALALEEDSPTLKMKHLKRYAPSVAQCSEMLREAIDGERELEEGKEARANLRTKLGLEPEPPNRGDECSSHNSTGLGVNTRRHKRRVGARNPVRDRVGK